MISADTLGQKQGYFHCVRCVQLHTMRATQIRHKTRSRLAFSRNRPPPATSLLGAGASCRRGRIAAASALELGTSPGERSPEIPGHAYACTSPPPIVQPGRTAHPFPAVFGARLLYCRPLHAGVLSIDNRVFVSVPGPARPRLRHCSGPVPPAVGGGSHGRRPPWRFAGLFCSVFEIGIKGGAANPQFPC